MYINMYQVYSMSQINVTLDIAFANLFFVQCSF